jgi:SET domain-containing protein 6
LPSINEGNEPLDNWGSLILVMLYEYLQGEASRWKPYFDVLPQQFDTPLFWTDAELKELKGTCLTPEKIGKEESDSMLRQRILPIVQQNLHIFYPEGATRLSEDELLALTHRIGSTIMAYAFDLEPENEEEEEYEEDGWVEDREGQNMLGMVPMADMLNANADFNVGFMFLSFTRSDPDTLQAHVDHAENLEVTTLRSDLKPGDEILNYYGPLPSSELLRRYGYVTPQHSRYDVAEIPWEVVRTFLNSHLVLSDEEMKSIVRWVSPNTEKHVLIDTPTECSIR